MRLKWTPGQQSPDFYSRHSEEALVQIKGVGDLIGKERCARGRLYLYEGKTGWTWKAYSTNWITRQSITRSGGSPESKTKARKEAESSLAEIALELEKLTREEARLVKEEESKEVVVSIDDFKKARNRSLRKTRPLKQTA